MEWRTLLQISVKQCFVSSWLCNHLQPDDTSRLTYLKANFNLYTVSIDEWLTFSDFIKQHRFIKLFNLYLIIRYFIIPG